MNRRYNRAERLLSWLSTPGNVENALAIVILVTVAYIFIRFRS
jgi:hypothetical protein